MKQNLGKVPPIWIADAGYGSEENYLALEAEGITPYVKYNSFEKDSKKKRKENEKEKYFLKHFKYDEGSDTFLCPENKRLIYERIDQDKSKTGFISEKRVYRCLECDGYPVRKLCSQSRYGRTIRYSLTLKKLRKSAFERLTSEEGKKTACPPIYGCGGGIWVAERQQNVSKISPEGSYWKCAKKRTQKVS